MEIWSIANQFDDGYSLITRHERKVINIYVTEVKTVNSSNLDNAENKYHWLAYDDRIPGNPIK